MLAGLILVGCCFSMVVSSLVFLAFENILTHLDEFLGIDGKPVDEDFVVHVRAIRAARRAEEAGGSPGAISRSASGARQSSPGVAVIGPGGFRIAQ
jgi:hypothetical protein